MKIGKSTTEETLIRECLQNDLAAQKSLFQRYAPGMLALCCRYIRDVCQAEDAMIRGFMIVFSKLNQYRHQGAFAAWIRRIMINECLGYLRKNKSMYVEVNIDKAEHDPQYSILQHKLETDDLMKMVQQLPIGYRTVFNLFAIEGYSHAEIAKMLHVSENTSKSQLNRARKLLQKSLLESERELAKIYQA